MTYTMDQVTKGVAAYLDNEFMPMLEESSIKKVLIGAAISIAISRYAAMVEVAKENEFVKALNVFDDNGNVDVDTIIPAIKQNMPKDGVKVNVPSMGVLTLKEPDVDKLKQYIQSAK